jgi:hypothetical protein
METMMMMMLMMKIRHFPMTHNAVRGKQGRKIVNELQMF